MELTQTENKVAELVARGLSEKEIASKLFVSPKTVHNHTYNIRKKIKARSNVDVARFFILRLDNPKQFFSAILFLVIQTFIMFDCADLDLRRPSGRSTRVIRVSTRTGRKNKDC